MTYVFSAGKFGVSKVGDLFATLKTLNSGAYNDILSGAGHLQPDGTVLKFADDVPVVKGDVIEWPNGSRLDLKENTVTLPNGAKAAATSSSRRPTGRAGERPAPPRALHGGAPRRRRLGKPGWPGFRTRFALLRQQRPWTRCCRQP